MARDDEMLIRGYTKILGLKPAEDKYYTETMFDKLIVSMERGVAIIKRLTTCDGGEGVTKMSRLGYKIDYR